MKDRSNKESDSNGTQDASVLVLTSILSAVIASMGTIALQRYCNQVTKNTTNKQSQNKKEVEEKSSLSNPSSDGSNNNNQNVLGPAQTPETRYQLNLRGKVDQIYNADKHQYNTVNGGPKPFEFNHQVVAVFDDMVSRSVPLYCEVTDLAIYWLSRYYQPGTTVYDLGCSTGTTIDVLARSQSPQLHKDCDTDGTSSSSSSYKCHFVGVDNSQAMVDACNEKLQWAKKYHNIEIHCGDILTFPIQNASFLLMNYTLQFIPIVHRQVVLKSIYDGMVPGGILFLSEKVRVQCSEIHETCTWIYEDFKVRRNYTKREIARKKEALMNVLIPYTEEELRNVLKDAGFDFVEVVAKWNNFTTVVAQKSKTTSIGTPSGNHIDSTNEDQSTKSSTPHLDALFEEHPVYLSEIMNTKGNTRNADLATNLQSFCRQRIEVFAQKGNLSKNNLEKLDSIASLIQQLPHMTSKRLIVNQPDLTIGDPDELTPSQMETLQECLKALRPWKKGPLNIFGTKVDTEWRSDWKWERLQKSLPELKDKTICDLGCGNGYYMFRMLEYDPKLVVGIDPNLHGFLEFQLFRRLSGVENLHFEFLRGDCMTLFTGVFDVVFCLGVLYHTHDPIGMLHDIYKSMKGGATLVVDCQGIEGEEPLALFPHKRYVNMKGVYFLPTLTTLKHWLQRANFLDFEVIFAEPLSTEEQRITDWAPVHTSLKESLDPNDPSKTIEGYPAPHRFYVRVRK